MAQDLQQGLAPPSPDGATRLISLFKEAKMQSRGLLLWNWLIKQGNEHVNATTYGAAIELLAENGEQLSTIEAVYQQALKRFPNGFVEYHFSPYAVVPQPDQQQRIQGWSQNLLQGIITARLLHGEVYGAYLGLDTALRLFHHQLLPRICEVFLEMQSLPMAYKILLIAIRNGVEVKPRHLRNLQSKIIE